MADEPTGDGTTEEPGTKDDPGTATTTDDGQGDDPELSSGDDLAKVRAEAARFRREARDWKKKAEDAARERDAATTTAEERLAKLEASERRNARATIERLAVAAGFHAGEPAHELDELAGLLAEDGGEAAGGDAPGDDRQGAPVPGGPGPRRPGADPGPAVRRRPGRDVQGRLAALLTVRAP